MVGPTLHEQENRTRAREGREIRSKEERVRKKGRDGRGQRERTVEAAAREERLRLRRYVVYVAGLQRGRRAAAPLFLLKWWRTPVQRAHGRYIYVEPMGENER